MMKRLFGAAAFAVVAAGVARAQDSDLVPGDREASAQLVKIMESTTSAGLPSDPILGLVRHGVVMQTPPARIVDAARRVASRLQLAREALGPKASDNDIAAAADAIGAGADRDALRAIRDANRNRPLAVPLGVLTQLLAQPLNTPLKQATQIVKDLINRGATSTQLVAFTNDLNADVANGMQALAAVDTRVRLLTAVLSPAGSAAGLTAVDAPAVAGSSKPTPPPPKRP